MNIIALLSFYKPRILKDLPKMKIGKSRKYKLTKNDYIKFEKLTINEYKVTIMDHPILNKPFYVGPATIILRNFNIPIKNFKKSIVNGFDSDSIVTKKNLNLINFRDYCYKIQLIELYPDNLNSDSYIEVTY